MKALELFNEPGLVEAQGIGGFTVHTSSKRHAPPKRQSWELDEAKDTQMYSRMVMVCPTQMHRAIYLAYFVDSWSCKTCGKH